MKIRNVFASLLLILAFAIPAAAQAQDTLTVSTGDIRLMIDKAFATGVSFNLLPADPTEFGPGFAEPASLQIGFSNPPPGFAPESILTIRIYETVNFAGYPEHERRLAQLQDMLANRPDLAGYTTYRENVAERALPFIPVYTHGQVLSARAEYVETPTFAGIQYIAAFSADVSPFNRNSFIYTIQGVTPDGKHYISAQSFISTDLFPAEPTIDDPAAFQANLPTYIEESIATLNAGMPEDFSPSLADIDAAMESLFIPPFE